MKIGLAPIFAWRPHVEHMHYVSLLLEEAGHSISYLSCDHAVSNCYARALKNTSALRECSKCIVGGIRSYPVRNVRSMKSNLRANLPERQLQEMCASTSYTVFRVEAHDELTQPDVLALQKSLYDPVDTVYANTLQWIEEEQLEGVVFFNGRMDLTAGVLQACRQASTPFIALERTASHGLWLTPNDNCLSLVEPTRLLEEFAQHPLTREQARFAAFVGAERYFQKSTLDWRTYNTDPERADWPGKHEGRRVLFLPSSRNEYLGHESWQSEWDDVTLAYDELMDHLSLKGDQCVLRCHPNWAQKIGKAINSKSEAHYTEWANARGVHLVPSADRRSTYDLLDACDMLVVNGSSTAVEAGFIGKPIVCIGPAGYQAAGYVTMIRSRKDWDRLDSVDSLNRETRIRKTLRHIYNGYRRLPQYVDYVRARPSLRYDYFSGADPDRLTRIFKSGRLEPDDNEFAPDESQENEAVKALLDRDWDTVQRWVETEKELPLLANRRRFLMRWIDPARALFPRGDT